MGAMNRLGEAREDEADKEAEDERTTSAARAPERDWASIGDSLPHNTRCVLP